MMAHFLYLWLVTVGVVDVLLVAGAIGRAPHAQTAGRLFATLLVLGGLTIAAVGRLLITVPLGFLAGSGLVMIDVGLLLYALYLPDQGLLSMWRQRR